MPLPYAVPSLARGREKISGSYRLLFLLLSLALLLWLALRQSLVPEWGPVAVAAREAFLREEWDDNQLKVRAPIDFHPLLG